MEKEQPNFREETDDMICKSEQICKYIRSENQFDKFKLTLQDTGVVFACDTLYV